MIKTILLAVDLGAHTSHLLQHAASLSKHYSARLVVVHAVEPVGTLGNALISAYVDPVISEKMTTSGLHSLIEQIRFQVIDTLTEEYMSGDIDLPRLGEVVVKPMSPVEAILSTAEECDADLVVVGSHSSSLGQQPLGSVSLKVLNLSKRPVYLVPHAQLIWERAPEHNQARPNM